MKHKLTTVFAVILMLSVFVQAAHSQQKMNTFLSFFEPVKFDTLHIYCPDGSDQRGFGTLIDTTYYELFDKTITNLVNNKIESSFSDEKIYACHKFKLSGTHIGLTWLRQHLHNKNSFDEDFNFDLIIFDTQKQKIEHTFEIAHSSFSSSVYLSETDAWLMDLDKDGNMDLVSRWKQWWSEDVTDIEHTSDYFNVYTNKNNFFKANKHYTNSLNKSKFELKNWNK